MNVKTATVNNTAGTARNLNTYSGPADILGMTDALFKTTIFGHAESIDTCYDLEQASFSGVLAVIDTEKKKKEILGKVHKAAFQAIIDQIFESICPNFLDDPERSFLQIKQTGDQDEVSLTVTQYYSVAMALLNNFKRGGKTEWKNDPAAHFVNHLNENIRIIMEDAKYTAHLGGHSTKPFEQIKQMAEAYKAAIIAENSIKMHKKLIATELSAVHGLTTLNVPTFMSPTEQC